MNAKELAKALLDYPDAEVRVWDIGYGDTVPVGGIGVDSTKVLILEPLSGEGLYLWERRRAPDS